MADIVQLAENGVLKYLKTHFKAVEGLEAELAKKENKLKKTGKVNITLAGTVPSTTYPFFYSIDGNQFEFGGRGKFPRNMGHTFFILPDGVRPIGQVIRHVSFMDSDSTKTAIFEINTDGTCKVYYSSSDAGEISISSLRFTIA